MSDELTLNQYMKQIKSFFIVEGKKGKCILCLTFADEYFLLVDGELSPMGEEEALVLLEKS